jgi:hypothetical protein
MREERQHRKLGGALGFRQIGDARDLLGSENGVVASSVGSTMVG